MVRVGSHDIGDGRPCLITFEAGATHEGLDSARSLVSLAARAGAGAVKFQIFDPDRLVADKSLLFTYEVLADETTGATRTVEEPLYDILCRRYLSPDQWRQVKDLCDTLSLAFFATVGFEEDIRLLEALGCDSIKIASADIDHWPLIRRAARTGMCVQLDTGCASLGEIEQAVDICRRAGNPHVVIHNCPSGYPARPDSINLRLIPTLKQMFPECAVAYSDHTPGWVMDVAAVALGVHLVEKTITLDRTIRSPEHLFSLEPAQMKAFVSTVREVEKAMGLPRRVLGPEEMQMRANIRRSAFLKSGMRKGEVVDLDRIEFRRPGFGISPNRMESLVGLRLARDLEKGAMLNETDLIRGPEWDTDPS